MNAFLYLNYKCNIKCKACYFDKTGYNKTMDELKEEVRILLEHRKLDTILLGGGEPTLHPNIIELIEYLRELLIEPILLTNGVNLTNDSLSKYKDAGIEHVIIHVDSNQNRADLKGDFLELADKIAKKVVANDLVCSLTSIIYPETLHELDRTIDHVIESELFLAFIGNCATYSFDECDIKEDSLKLVEVKKILDKRGEPKFVLNSRLSNEPRWLFYNIKGKIIQIEQFGSFSGDEIDYCDNCPDLSVHKGQVRPACCCVDSVDQKHFEGVKWNQQL